MLPDTARGWTLQLHGPPQLLGASAALALERKAAALLCWLALRGPAPRASLAEALWPAASNEGARNNLRQLIFRLRRQAGGAHFVVGNDELRLAEGLQVAPPDLDAPLLAGCSYDDCQAFDEWLAQARQARHDAALAARLHACDVAEHAGDLDTALALARALVAADPLQEPAQLRLVRVLYLRGERAAALGAAQACEAALRQGLDIAPSPALQALVAQVRAADAPAAKAPSAAAAALPVTVLRPPRLVGRERELALLRQHLAAGHEPWLLGEPGLGKTRLLAEAFGHDAAALICSARPGDAGVPFATLARLLRALLARWPAALPPGRAGALLRRVLPDLAPPADAAVPGAIGALHGDTDLPDAVRDTLHRAAAAGLVCVVLDDLHFADDATLDVVADAVPEEAPRWVFARRPAEGGTALALFSARRLASGRAAPLALAPLGEASVLQLLLSLAVPGLDAAGLAAPLWRRTGGNPLFVLETLKAAWPQWAARGDAALPSPRNVTALIQQRLQQLSAPALALARVAAMAGPDFDTALAVHVLETPALALTESWAELEAAAVLRDAAFAHDLVQEVVLQGVPAPIRRHVHAAIATYLEPRGSEPARIAAHWLACEQPARAALQFRAAAARAEAGVRYAEAQALLEQAADCSQRAGNPTEALGARLALADLLRESGKPEQAMALMAGLESAAPTLDERLQVVRDIGRALSLQGKVAQACQQLSRLLDDDEVLAEATPFRVAELRHTLADAQLAAGDAGAALQQLALARPHRDREDDPQIRGWFHSDWGRALIVQGNLKAGIGHLETALACARRTGRQRMVAGVLQVLTHAHHNAGALTAALEHAEEARLLVAEAGDDNPLGHALLHQCARELIQLGRWREAMALLEQMGGASRRPPSGWYANFDGLQMLAWSQLGRPDRAMAAFEHGRPLCDTPALRRMLLNARIELAWMQEEPREPWLDELEVLAAAVPMATQRCRLLRWREKPDTIEPAALAAAREGWLAVGLEGFALMADVLGCQRAAAAGDADAAVAFGRRALLSMRRITVPGLYRPGLWLALAEALDRAELQLAARARQDGFEWVHAVARFHLDAGLQAGFLRDNRVNRALLARAG